MGAANEPIFKSIREIAKTGILSEYYLRQLCRQGKLPGLKIGKKFLVNYSKLVELLNDTDSLIYR